MSDNVVYALAPDSPGWPCRVPGFRQVKFRVFDLVTRTMLWDGPLLEELITHLIARHNKGLRYRLMQWTGLEDKNAVGVYEGDIVKASSQGAKGTFQVRWRQEALPGFFLYPAWSPSEGFWKLHGTNEAGVYYDTGVEVIGNVYATPELGPVIRGECRWCLAGMRPMLLDDDGTKVEVTNLPGKMRHANTDGWWDCETPEEAKDARWLPVADLGDGR